MLKFNEFTDTVKKIGSNQEMKITHAERDVTVSPQIKYNKRYICEWTDNNKNSFKQTFHEDELELIKRESIF